MNHRRLRALKLSGWTFGVFILLLAAYQVNLYFTFHVVKTNPALRKISVVSPFFNIDFNEALSGAIVTSDSNIIKSYSINDKEIRVILKIPLDANTSYSIKLDNIRSKSGHLIASKIFTFKPSSLSGNNLPADQAKILLQNQSNYANSILNNSLVNILPFTGPNFEYQIDYSVNYTNSGDKLIIIITAPTEAAKHDALSWLTSQSYDLNKLKIEYVNKQP